MSDYDYGTQSLSPGKMITGAVKTGIKALNEVEKAQKRAEVQRRKNIRAQARKEAQEAKSRAIIAEIKAKMELSRATLEDRYSMCFRNHRELCNHIEQAVQKRQTSDVIAFCEEDVKLIPMIYDYCTRKSILEGTEYPMEHIDTYSYLSAAYEEIGDFDRAILACKDAIDIGITKGMQERIAMLQQKRKEMLIYG